MEIANDVSNRSIPADDQAQNTIGSETLYVRREEIVKRYAHRPGAQRIFV